MADVNSTVEEPDDQSDPTWKPPASNPPVQPSSSEDDDDQDLSKAYAKAAAKVGTSADSMKEAAKSLVNGGKKKTKLQKSVSTSSYFGKEGTKVKDEGDDEDKPEVDGFLDHVDRNDRNDLNWSTPVSPQHSGLRKRKSPARDGIDCWKYMKRIKTELHLKYRRHGTNMAPYTHACVFCGATISCGWSKRSKTEKRLPEGSWQSTIPMRHLRSCAAADDLVQTTIDMFACVFYVPASY